MTRPRTISASQINTFQQCNRFWYLQRIVRLKEPPQQHFTFGTVMHQCIERWLLADKNGRVPFPEDVAENGNTPWLFHSTLDKWVSGPLREQKFGAPVDLYPEDWEHARGFKEELEKKITPNEGKLIKKLIKEAIEQGILKRREGVQVERKLTIEVVPGANLLGFVDEYYPDGPLGLPEVHDQKSYGKGSVSYLKRNGPKDEDGNLVEITDKAKPKDGPEKRSPNCLGDEQQMLTYATVTNRLDGRRSSVFMQHHQFPKFPKKAVTVASAIVTQERLDQHWAMLQDVASQMLKVAKIEKWSDVSGPDDPGCCSRWYGKVCPMATICGRSETIDSHKRRVDRLIKQDANRDRPNAPLPTPKRRQKRDPSMGIFDKANAMKKGTASSTPSPENTPAAAKQDNTKAAETASVNSGAVAETVETTDNGAPWANPDCRACKGRGISKTGSACAICDNTAKRAGRPTSKNYIVDSDDEGLAIVVARDEHAEELEVEGMPLEWIEADGPTAPVVKPAPKKAKKAPAKDTAKEDAEAAAKLAEAKEQAAVAEEAESRPETPQEPETEPETVSEEPAPEPTPEPKKAKGRPTVGVVILLNNAGLIRGLGSRKTISAAELLQRFGAELAEAMGADSYYELDTWKRRERLAQKAQYMVDECARLIVMGPGTLGNDDEGSMLRAMMGAESGVDMVIG